MLFQTTQRLVLCFAALVFVAAPLQLLNAQTNPDKVLNSFMTADVVGVAYIDIENLDLEKSVEMLDKLGFRETIRYQQLLDQIPDAKKDIAKLKVAGLSRAYALLRTSDIQAMGTSFVMPVKEGSDPQQAIEAFKEVIAKLSGGNQPDYKVESRDGALIAAADAQFERLKSEKAEGAIDRPDIWAAIGNGSFGFAVFGDEDSRRVVEELMPELPSPFDDLNGELVADGTKWFGMSLKLDAVPELNFEIETSSEDAAKTYELSLIHI